jgi:tetratricopeptide (TPR) repeat protein
MTRAAPLVLSIALLLAPAWQRRPVPPVPAAQAAHTFVGEEGLIRSYDLILDARFDDVAASLRRACGPAPPEACQVLEATALWWQIQLDPDSLALDSAFSTSVDRAIQSAEAWIARAPESDEAWFYLGGAYAARVQWRVLRAERLAAARDGKRIKEALEHALVLNPDLDDAYFGIGMYQYYADVAPAAARFLRFLLLLPGGDREEGLAQMLRARSRGRLLQGEADYQIHIIYLWYEQETERAIELLRGLAKRYPENPLFPWQIAEIQDTYQHDITASLNTWLGVLADARAGGPNADLAEVRARLGIARHLDQLGLTDEAIEHLQRVVALAPAAPYGSLALAHLRLGEALDRMHDRPRATAAYRSAVDLAPTDPLVGHATNQPIDIRRLATTHLRRAPAASRAEAYRLSLSGWRALERKDVDAAEVALTRSIALDGREPIARYRLGRVRLARADDALARQEFERVIGDRERAPAPLVGESHLELGRLFARSGARDRAISHFRIAATYFGASSETHAAAQRALALLEK